MSGSRFIRGEKPPTLMPTSLLDMFTIILIFLILSYDAESQDFRLDPNVSLPDSTTQTQLEATVNVRLTPVGLSIGSDDVVEIIPLTDGRLRESDYEADEVPELVERLREEHDRRYGEDAIAPEPGPPVVIVQADRSVNYQTLYVVLRSAARAGFFKYRLAAIKAN